MERVDRRSGIPRLALAAAALLLGLVASPLHALELRVLSAGAVEPGMRPALAAFERDSGHAVRIEFAAATALREALRPAPVADVIVVPQGVVDELAATGGAGAGPLVRSGLYVERMLQRLGVDDVVRPKSERLADGASVMRRLLAGTSAREFGFGALTEIGLFTDQGLKLVGPLPEPLQNYTTYVALPWPGAQAGEPARADAVAALMRWLNGAPARSLFSNAGIAPAP